MNRTVHSRFRWVLALAVVLATLAGASATQALAAGARWDIVARSAPSTLTPGQPAEITVVILNLGNAAAHGTAEDPIVLTDQLPAGVIAKGAMDATADTGVARQSRPSLSCHELTCSFVGTVPPFISIEATIPVEATSQGNLGENEVTVEGGKNPPGPSAEVTNVPPASARDVLTASSSPTTFGIERFELTPEAETGATELQAGSHPYQLTTTLELNQILAPDVKTGQLLPATPGLLKNLSTVLPAGLVADTLAVPTCSNVDFTTVRSGASNLCPADTALGAVVVTFKEPVYETRTETIPVFNLVPAEGEPARFGFEFDGVPITLDTSIRTGEGYEAEVRAANTPQSAEVLGTILTIWGVPADQSHNNARGWACLGGGHFIEVFHYEPCAEPKSSQARAYLTQPTTACGQPQEETFVRAQSWEPGAVLGPEIKPKHPFALQGCEKLPFAPAITVTPDRLQTSTPTGLDVEITVPQETTLAANGLGEADIKETTMELPEGLQVSAGAADGLETCGVREAGFAGSGTDTGPALETELAIQRFNSEQVNCPSASKIGEVAIRTPLLQNELKGYVYLGQQNTNPFTSPLVLYLIAEDPVSGVRVKLAGEVNVNPDTGQLISSFKNTPPLPFQALRVHLFDGPRASQATPAYCRAYTSTARFVPWSGEAAAQRTSSFTPTSGPDAAPCQTDGALPFAPTEQSGSVDNQAGAFSPFTVTIKRPDGNQALRTITVHLPPGAAAILASVTPCPEPQAAHATCPADSLIGHSTASSGLGPNPVTLGGDVYLTGPYKGAPFGLLAVTHAQAGPFNLGDVPVRSAITVDPYTAAATVTSDPVPQIIKGAPAQIKQINVTIDRPGFDFNPTNCSPLHVTGALRGYEGGEVSLSNPFQVSNCASLPFKPVLTVSTGANFSRSTGASFKVRVTSSFGQANIAKTRLVIPSSLPSRLSTIQKACPNAVFLSTPVPGTACGEGSMIGEGIAHTPVLRSPLKGPAYLVSYGSAAFPDVEFVLQGEDILLILDGQTDITKGVTTSTFNTVPDAPVSSFEAVLPAGPHSALAAYLPGKSSLCGSNLIVPTTITGQNGAVIKQVTRVHVEGCKGVLSFKAGSDKRLAAAVKMCRRRHSAHERRACESAARRRYGSKNSRNSKTYVRR